LGKSLLLKFKLVFNLSKFTGICRCLLFGEASCLRFGVYFFLGLFFGLGFCFDSRRELFGQGVLCLIFQFCLLLRLNPCVGIGLGEGLRV